MNFIRILVVDDDLLKITTIIDTVREIYNDTLAIDQASSVQEAIEHLREKDYHLMITDLQMPLKYDDISLDDKAGEALIRSLYRKKTKVNIPLYIVALTQHRDFAVNYSEIWNLWFYDRSVDDWRLNLRQLIFHISLIKSRILPDKIETFFVEGPTDKKVFAKVLDLYFQELSGSVNIETIPYGGGASWVERQLFIWAKSLSRKETDGCYLKAVGVLDNDGAGIKAATRLDESLISNSAESETYSVVYTHQKYSVPLKSIRSKGITFSTELEDLFSESLWETAESRGWLENRPIKDLKLDSDILKLEFDEINENSLLAAGFSREEVRHITLKVSDDYKEKFCNLLCASEKPDLIYLSYLVRDALGRLKLL